MLLSLGVHKNGGSYMKKVISLVLSFIIIAVMMPIPVHSESEVGTLKYQLIDESSYIENVPVEVIIENADNITNESSILNDGSSKLVEVNATTSSVIRVTVDIDENGFNENDLTVSRTLPSFAIGSIQDVIIIVRDGEILIQLVDDLIEEPLKAVLEFSSESQYPSEGRIKFVDTERGFTIEQSFFSFLNNPIILKSTSDKGLSFNLIIDTNQDGLINDEDQVFQYNGYVETDEPFVVLSVSVGISSIEVSEISNNIAFVELEAESETYFMHYNVENTKKLSYTSTLYKPGTYEVFAYSFINDTYSVIELGEVVVDAGDNKTKSFTILDAPKYSLNLNFNVEGYDLTYDVIKNLENSIFSRYHNPGVNVLETNIEGLTRIVEYSTENGHISFELRDIEFDFSEIYVELSTTVFEEEFSAKDHIMFVDKNGNRMKINSLYTGEPTIEFTDEFGIVFNGYFGDFSIGHLKGQYGINVRIPELGIDFSEPVYINGTPDKYEDYTIRVENLDGTENKGVFSYYDNSNNHKRIVVYVPESSENKLLIHGVNGEEKTKLSVSLNENDSSRLSYDETTDILSVGSVLGGYGDYFWGTIDDEISLDLRSYKGNLGVMDISTPDGTPYTGEVNLATMYKFTGYGNSGSFSSGSAFNGKLAFPIRTDFIGLDYAYVVVSPLNQGNSKYANTPFVDLTSNISTPQEGVYDLGEASLQQAMYTGRVYAYDGVTPVTNIHVMATGHYKGTKFDFNTIEFSPSYGTTDIGWDTFYFAPLGPDFTDDLTIRIVKFNSDFQTLDAELKLSDGEGTFVETAPQIIVHMYDDQGQLLPEGSGLDRSMQAMIKRGSNYIHSSLTQNNTSTARVGGFEEGDEVSMWLNLDVGDFDHLRLLGSNRVKFTYTSFPGTYEAIDDGGNIIPFIVDENGIMHIDFHTQKSQLFGWVKMGDQFADSGLRVSVLDPITREIVAFSNTHSAGGFNGEEVMHGVVSIGHHTKLDGEYIIFLEDPSDTVNYSGTEFKVNFPLDEDLTIQLPESRAFGKVQLSEVDEIIFANNFLRVFVNIFNENGKYIKNARVRNDGLFSVGELLDGRYFAKVYVSPFSPLAEKYATSKMHMFELNSGMDKFEFNTPLIQTIGKGMVKTPGNEPVMETWVNIINAQGIIIESVKTNSNGEFPIPMLKDGKYTFKALGNYGYFDSIGKEIVVENSSVNEIPLLHLSTEQIVGTILNDQETPTAGTIFIFDELKKLVTSVYSDTGHFALGGLSIGKYYVQVKPENGVFDSSEMLSFIYEGTLKFITIELTKTEYSGHVLDPMGNPVSEGWVHLYKNMQYVKSVSIDSEGSYAIGGIDTSETFTVLAESMNQLSDMTSIGENKVLDIILGSGEAISGVLMINDEIFSKGKFVIYNSKHEAIFSSITNVFGEFALIGLEPGTYYVVVIMGESYFIKEISIVTENSELGTINLTEGE